MAESPNQTYTTLFTPKTLFALAGASVGVWLFTSVLASVFGVNTDKYKWIGLCVALFLSFVAAFRIKKPSLELITVAFFNGLLIYVNAVGINAINQGAHAVTETKPDHSNNAALIPMDIDEPWWPAVVLIDSIKITRLRYDTLMKKSVELEHTRQRLLQLSRSLEDQISAFDSAKVKKISNDELQNCVKQNKRLQQKIDELLSVKSKSANAVGGDKKAQVNEKPFLDLLEELKELNKNLLISLNSYIGAGNLNPKGQANAYRSANERVMELKNDLKNYNERVDLLSKEIAGANK